MKTQLRKLFWFLLVIFEKGEGPYNYKPMNRKILIVVGLLFIFLCSVGVYFTIEAGVYSYLLPVAVFFIVGFVSLIVGLLGSDRAVSNIWGNK